MTTFNKTLGIYAIAIGLGLVTGLVGTLFQVVIRVVTRGVMVFSMFATSHGFPPGIGSAVLSMILVFVAWFMVQVIAPEAAGSGVQEMEGALLHERPVLWRRLLPVKFIAGVLALSSKMVVGREGPTIQMGGNLGEMFGEWLHLARHQRDTLIAAGSAAGLATAFNAPLAGVLFVLEEMRDEFDFSFTNFTAVTTCCVAATIVLHAILGSEPAIPMAVFETPSLRSLLLFFIFGIFVGFMGLLFNVVLMKSLYRMDAMHPIMRLVYVLIVGFFVGYMAYAYPKIVGGGYEIIETALTMTPTFSVLMLLVLVRFVMTMICYNTGVPGGIFAPMLALGTLLGLAMSQILDYLMIDMSVHPGMFAVAGMGALFAAAVRAPITGIVLVVEMTHNYLLILPLMVTCLTATSVVQLAKNPAIYAQLLNRTLKRSGRNGMD